MKITIQAATDRARSAIICEPENYDGAPPITRVEFDYRTHQPLRGHVAIAGALLFDRFVNGAFSAPPMSPMTADALRRWFAPRSVAVEGVDAAAHAVSELGRRLILDDGGPRGAALVRLYKRPGDVRFRLADLESVGAALSEEEAVLHSNAAAFLSLRSTISDTLPRIAAAFALLGDFGINQLFIPDTAAATLHCRDRLSFVAAGVESKLAKLQRLLASVNVRLEAPFAGLSDGAVFALARGAEADFEGWAGARGRRAAPSSLDFELDFQRAFLRDAGGSARFAAPEEAQRGFASGAARRVLREAIDFDLDLETGAAFAAARDAAYSPYRFAMAAEPVAA